MITVIIIAYLLCSVSLVIPRLFFFDVQNNVLSGLESPGGNK